MTIDITTLELPKDRKTMNATNRFYYNTEKVVTDAINAHIWDMAKSSIRFVAKDDASQGLLDALITERNIYYTAKDTVMAQMAFEYWVFGETFPYTELGAYPSVGAIATINPAQIRVKKALNGPDQIQLLAGESKSMSDIADQQPAAKNISHLKMLASPYDIRGTSVIASAYKELVALDEMRKDDRDATQINAVIEVIREKLMFGDEAARQAKYAEFRLALTEWFEKIMNQVPELAGSTIKFD